MIEKTCRCGDTKKNFKIDIGEFFIAECCEAKGYDHLGKKKVDPSDLGLDNDKLNEELNSEATKNLTIEDEGEQPDPNEEMESQDQSQNQEQVQDGTSDESEELDEDEARLEAEQLEADAEVEKAENTPIVPEAKLEVNEEGGIVQASSETEVSKEEPKKKRQYNRNGKIKPQS